MKGKEIMEYIPAIILYSIGVFMLGYQFREAKYKYTMEELTRKYAEEENDRRRYNGSKK